MSGVPFRAGTNIVGNSWSEVTDALVNVGSNLTCCYESTLKLPDNATGWSPARRTVPPTAFMVNSY